MEKGDNFMEEIVYVDHSATTYVKKEVLNEMLPYFTEKYGNASSIYSKGVESKEAIEKARRQVSEAIGCDESEVYFTAGGSEADNLALLGISRANRHRGNHIITTKIEHLGVLDTCKALEKEGFEVTYLNVDEDGIVNLEELKNAITEKTILITIMFANNEIGTIEPIEEIGKIAKEHKIFFHTDAVQAVGNIDIDVNKLNIDLLSLSAHKFYGPKGVGALFVRKTVRFNKIMDGGHQERNKRAGTENVASIIGLAKALEMAYEKLEENNKHLEELRDLYISEVEAKIPYIKLNGHRTQRLPGNANISFKCIEGESLLLNLDLKGMCASSGSACTSGSLDPSHVLLAIGLSHAVAHGSLRISFGVDNTKEDVEFLVNHLIEIVERLRNMSPLYEDFINGDYVM